MPICNTGKPVSQTQSAEYADAAIRAGLCAKIDGLFADLQAALVAHIHVSGAADSAARFSVAISVLCTRRIKAC